MKCIAVCPKCIREHLFRTFLKRKKLCIQEYAQYTYKHKKRCVQLYKQDEFLLWWIVIIYKREIFVEDIFFPSYLKEILRLQIQSK